MTTRLLAYRASPKLALAGGLLLIACLIFWYFAPTNAIVIQGNLIQNSTQSLSCDDCLQFAVSNSSQENLIGKNIQLLGDPEKINPLKQVATPNTPVCFEAREHVIDIGKENLRSIGAKLILVNVIDMGRCGELGG